MENKDLEMIIDGIYGFLKNINESIKNTNQNTNNKEYQELAEKLVSIENKLSLMDNKLSDADMNSDDENTIREELQSISNKLDEYRELQPKSKIDIIWLRLGTIRKVLLLSGIAVLFLGMFIGLIYLKSVAIISSDNSWKYRYLKTLDKINNDALLKIENGCQNKEYKELMKRSVEYSEQYQRVNPKEVNKKN